MKLKENFQLWISLIYLVFGVFWIVLTDIIVHYFVPNSENWSKFQSLKGIVFVIISSCVLFFIARHYVRQQQKIKKKLHRALKKAEENEQLKSAFLANMSHEIRTPMNGIIGFIHLLEEGDFQSDKHPMYLEYLKKSSQRMLETINDIIVISQIDSNQSQVKVTEIDLNESIDFLYNFFLPLADEKGLKLLLINRLPRHHGMIRTDKSKLESILSNLLKNAIKFSPSGIVEFCSFIRNDEVVFYVKDNGIGIPPDFQKVIFERFVQADTSTTRPYEGSGLGLAIAKAYAGLLNGKIWLESEESKGSTFWLSLPYVYD